VPEGHELLVQRSGIKRVGEIGLGFEE